MSGCGKSRKPCKNITYALTEYHRETGNQWASCIKLHLSSTQNLHDLNDTGLQGFGNPSYKRGQHTHIQILYEKNGVLQNDSTSISIQEVNFEHLKLSVRGLNTNITNCTFKDSSLIVNDAHLLDIESCSWMNTTNITLLGRL